ncbi:methionine--tRNA ligase, partial [Candidatus Gottesmanbacteria bacterium]|nr:methionine--tRNA ligase [Candidatus Gottesmanbacteria bacterium]
IGEGGRGFDVFQKGSDTTHHYPSSQKLWELCAKNGDIYKKEYEGLYCVGCEAFYALEELDEKGQCFEHPGKKLDKVSEENYFFRLSKYQKQLIELIKNDTLKIVPEKRKNEVLAFLERGLDDISISRSNERAKNWGVPVPNDSKQRIYVWFDALNIYQSGVGFGWDEKTYKKWWPTDVHVIGKGITRFHAVYWPAFLLSAHLALPKTIFVHEYFTVNGQKMSKTLGNVIDPLDLITKYGADPLRYYFLAKFSPFHDGNFSEGEFKKTYNADLANGLGNLISRIAKLCEQNGINEQFDSSKQKLKPEVQKYLDKFEFSQALGYIWRSEIRWGLKWLDQDINNEKPWQIVDKKLLKLKLHVYVSTLRDIAYNLSPFLPQTAKKILDQFNGTIKSRPPLFPRLS